MAETTTRKHPPLVLIANDQEWASRAIETILGPAGYAVLRAYTAQDALARGRSAQPDVIVLDVRLPGMDGLAVCRTLRSDPRVSPSTPIVMTTTAPGTRTQRLEALRAGANEYFGQPLDGEEFLLRLDSYVRAKFDADRARDEGIIDASTGFYNMRGLARRARELGSAAFRHHGPLGCVVLAPEVEDETPASEEALTAAVEQLAELLRRAGRVSDAIGRLGPSEFAVIAPATDAAGLEKLVNRLAERIGPGKIRAGYDAVTNLHAAGLDPVDLLIHATSALRASKADPGRDRIRRFQQQDPTAH